MVSRYAIASGTADVRLIKDARPRRLLWSRSFRPFQQGRSYLRYVALTTGRPSPGWSRPLVIIAPLPAFPRRRLARVMKQILLRVTAVFTEIFLCEGRQFTGFEFPPAGKIALLQNPLDPNIDRKSA